MRKLWVFLTMALVLLSLISITAAGSDLAQQSGDPYDEEETGYFTCCCGFGAIILILVGISLGVAAVARKRYAERLHK